MGVVSCGSVPLCLLLGPCPTNDRNFHSQSNAELDPHPHHLKWSSNKGTLPVLLPLSFCSTLPFSTCKFATHPPFPPALPSLFLRDTAAIFCNSICSQLREREIEANLSMKPPTAPPAQYLCVSNLCAACVVVLDCVGADLKKLCDGGASKLLEGIQLSLVLFLATKLSSCSPKSLQD